MSGQIDQAKGKVKEAAGDLTGNRDLEREGKADRVGGEAKEKIEQVGDKVSGAIDKAKDAVKDHTGR